MAGTPLLVDHKKDCEGCPSCDPPRPIVCRHCPDLNISANSAVGGYIGEASYSDLELVLEGKYRLMFTCWNSFQGRQLSIVSRQFAVLNSDPSYPFVLESVPPVNSHRRYDPTTMMPGPCSESVPPRGGEGALTEAPRAFRRGGNLGRVGFDTRSFGP